MRAALKATSLIQKMYACTPLPVELSLRHPSQRSVYLRISQNEIKVLYYWTKSRPNETAVKSQGTSMQMIGHLSQGSNDISEPFRRCCRLWLLWLMQFVLKCPGLFICSRCSPPPPSSLSSLSLIRLSSHQVWKSQKPVSPVLHTIRNVKEYSTDAKTTRSDHFPQERERVGAHVLMRALKLLLRLKFVPTALQKPRPADISSSSSDEGSNSSRAGAMSSMWSSSPAAKGLLASRANGLASWRRSKCLLGTQRHEWWFPCRSHNIPGNSTVPQWT